MDVHVYGWMNGKIHGQMNERKSRWLHESMDEQRDTCTR